MMPNTMSRILSVIRIVRRNASGRPNLRAPLAFKFRTCIKYLGK